MSRNLDMTEKFVKAYDDFSDAIFRHCYFRIGDRERARDLMQETFTKSWQYIIQGTAVNNIKPFLYKVANNLIIDEYRKKKELSLDRLQASGFDPGHDDRSRNDNSMDARFAIEKIKQLDEKYRDVVLLKFIDDLPLSEIAEIVGENVNNVSVRIHRGIKQLKELLDDGQKINRL